MFTRLACLGLSLIPVKERERVSGKVSNERFVNSCLANSPSVYLYTASNGRFLKPNKLQNHGNEGRGKEKKKSEEKERTRRKKQWSHS